MSPEQRDVVAIVAATATSRRILLVVSALSALLAIAASLPLIFYPYQLDYGEGLMLEGATSLRHGDPLYPNPFRFPTVVHVYGPVAYGATALVERKPSFPAGRLLVLVCSLTLVMLLGWILHNWTGSWLVGLSFGLLLLALPAFRFWLYLLRADMIGLLLSVLGLALYVWKEKLWHCSVALFALALFCKYTLMAAPLAVIVHLLLNGRRKRGIGVAVALGTLCAVAFAVLQVRTGGWFAFHMFSTHPDRYSLVQLLTLGFLVWASAPLITGLALWHVAEGLHAGAKSLAAIYFVTSSLTALTAGKLGSTTNHFLEWMVASCLCAGLQYSALLAKAPSKVLPATVLLSLSILAPAIIQSRASSQPWSELTDCGKAYQYLHNSGARAIFSENVGPLVLENKPVLLSDSFVYLQSVKRGRWPNQDIEKRIEQRSFDLMVISRDPQTRDPDIWPQQLLDTISRNYHVVERFHCRGAEVMLVPNSQRKSGEATR